MWKPKWPKIELPSSRVNITIMPELNFKAISINRKTNVSKLILSNIRNSTNNGTKISSKLRKRMLKPLVNLKIDIPKRLKAIGRLSRKGFL